MRMENERLEELMAYQILDTTPEKELDELAEIASLIFDVPISLITLLDENRQWFKANKGLRASETKIEDSFCQHALHTPQEVLVVNDANLDLRFKNSALVTGEPNIRFYAGAPLETPNGNVLGTLCIIDTKPREISVKQQKALQILAKKAMDYMNARKVLVEQKDQLETSAAQLKKLTDNVPGGIFQLRRYLDGEVKFEFLSKGMKELHPDIERAEWFKSAKIGLPFIHPDDVENFEGQLLNSFNRLSFLYMEYRALVGQEYKWYSMSGKPEKMTDGSVVWYGIFQNINDRVEYESTMEQIAFDISHVLRRPVTSLLGLTELIDTVHSITKEEFKECIEYIKAASQELDTYTRDLNDVYQKKKELITARRLF